MEHEVLARAVDEQHGALRRLCRQGAQAAAGAAPLLNGLAGKVVGFIDNAKPNFNHLVEALSEVLVSQHGVAKVLKERKPSASVPADKQALAGIVAEADLIITGSGD